jgi:hypothetical protein
VPEAADLALMDVSDVAELGPISRVHQLLPVNSRNEQLEKRRALELFRRIQKLSIGILGSIFTMHAHRNAFDGIDFSANEHGILVATAEDHLHSFESGVMLNLSEVAYGGLTDTEWNELECTIRMTVRGCSSSVLAKYPRGTLKTDFGKLTNCSHKEKVDSVFYLLIGLHTQRGCEVFEQAHDRQKKKYLTFPTKTAIASLYSGVQKNKTKDVQPSTKREDSKMDTDSDADSVSSDETKDSDDDTDGDSESELNANAKNSTSGELPASAFPYQKDLLHGSDHYRKYPFDYTNESIEFVCQELRRHGFGFLMDDMELDPYQLDLLMITSWGVLHPLRCKQKHPSSKTIKPKEEWARLFLDWTKELRTQQETGSGRSRNHLHW